MKQCLMQCLSDHDGRTIHPDACGVSRLTPAMRKCNIWSAWLVRETNLHCLKTPPDLIAWLSCLHIEQTYMCQSIWQRAYTPYGRICCHCLTHDINCMQTTCQSEARTVQAEDTTRRNIELVWCCDSLVRHVDSDQMRILNTSTVAISTEIDVSVIQR